MKNRWRIKATNNITGKSGYPFYNGFRTKRDAIEIIEQLNKVHPDWTHTLIKE